MALRPVPIGPFLKGVIASADPLTQPKGSVSRASNLLMSVRGALSTCDGSAIINAFNGVPTPSRGRFESMILFEPISVAPYYLVLAPDSSRPLGPPQHLTIVNAGSGALAAGTYYYVVTALDGGGGETNASNEVSITVSANQKVTLTWNVVPNAWGYNVYRGTSPGGEIVLIGTGLPLAQPSPLTPTVSYTDGGSSGTGPFPPAGFGISEMSTAGTNRSGQAQVKLNSTNASAFYAGKTVNITGNSNSFFNGSFKSLGMINASTFTIQSSALINVYRQNGTGGTATDPGPPVADNTSQVVMYLMPNGVVLPISYSDANIVAVFPMVPASLGVSPSGGSGGSTGLSSSTPSGGIVGMTSLLPQMAQFTNRVTIALGNGFGPQLYWDSTGSLVNPAPTGAITAISVDAFGVVTVTTSTTLSTTDPTKPGFLPIGTNVLLSGITNTAYIGGPFVVISVNTGAGTFTLRNLAAIGQSSSSGGKWTTATSPIINTFVPVYPSWVASSSYALNSIVEPTSPNGFYYKVVQAGVSAASQPTFPTGVNAQVSDGTIIWQNAGTTQSAAPPPPGAGHITVYAGSLWAWNTYPTDATSGLDGPTALRMSDVNNPNSWNPVNQAFIDKDDGTEGMGLATFTISAEGIPPEGSLVAFKNYSGYQIIGVFGSTNFAIQRIRSDMGCTAPRSIKFVPGFGIMRYAHLGVTNFDGVRDTITSEEVRPYLFPSNSSQLADIVVADPAWIAVSSADLTANPTMYAFAIPIGASSGALSRLLCYDLVLKSWVVVDTPFAFSLVYQARAVTAVPLTLLGGFSDGLLQRWQAGDTQWLAGGSSPEPAVPVLWNVDLPQAIGRTPDQKLQFRRVAVRGISNGATSLSVTPQVNGVSMNPQAYPVPSSGDFEVFSGVWKDGWRLSATLSGAGQIEIDRVTFHVVDKTVGVPQVIS